MPKQPQHTPAKKEQGQMSLMKFRLLAGAHIQDDKTKEPQEVTDPRTGATSYTYPSATYKAGDVVYSDVDLVQKHGASKFERLGESTYRTPGTGNPTPGDPTPENLVAGSHFPHGQVSTGFPQAVTAPDRGPVQQGPMDPELVEEVQAQHAEDAAQQEKQAAQMREEEEQDTSSKPHSPAAQPHKVGDKPHASHTSHTSHSTHKGRGGK